MSRASYVVLKFGSSVLRDEQSLPAVVAEIQRFVESGQKVIAVVSALGSTTDHLSEQAARIGGNSPEASAFARLLATGEARSVALVSLALGRAGSRALPFDPFSLSLLTTGPLLDAKPQSLKVENLQGALETHDVAVIPGFVGHNKDWQLTLLGRGGSDLTALFVAVQIKADVCRLVKDVDGLYEHDPALPGPKPRRYQSIRYDDALQNLDSRIVQRKAIHFARDHALEFQVGAIGAQGCTRVGCKQTVLEQARSFVTVL